ncbi:hypothetical protein KKH43_02635 [Patescibacteria group bacterium]|nr:hypothetical protein [Patescibacteria group bacterium]
MEEEKKDQYKCATCGSLSDEPGECCGQGRAKSCDCGDGDHDPSCCST